MDPPARPVSKRRAAPTQSSSLVSSHKYPSDASPSPFASTPKSMHTNTTEVLRPRPRAHGQTVAMEWDEDNDTPSSRTSRLQIELAECVETKTVTTTTTTKRSYPPLLFRQKGLDMLDAKEYPLALKPTPDELKRISYNVDGQSMSFFGDEFRASPPKVSTPFLLLNRKYLSNKSNYLIYRVLVSILRHARQIFPKTSKSPQRISGITNSKLVSSTVETFAVQNLRVRS